MRNPTGKTSTSPHERGRRHGAAEEKEGAAGAAAGLAPEKKPLDWARAGGQALDSFFALFAAPPPTFSHTLALRSHRFFPPLVVEIVFGVVFSSSS